MVLVTEKVPPQVVQRQNFVPEASGGVSLSAESFHLLVHSLTHSLVHSFRTYSFSVCPLPGIKLQDTEGNRAWFLFLRVLQSFEDVLWTWEAGIVEIGSLCIIFVFL